MAMKENNGSGRITAELIKYGTEKQGSILRYRFERILNGEQMPNEWREAQVISSLSSSLQVLNTYSVRYPSLF